MTDQKEQADNNLKVAEKLLNFLTGNEDADWVSDPVLVVDEDGELGFFNRACGISDDETVLIERVEQDSFGLVDETTTPQELLSMMQEMF